MFIIIIWKHLILWSLYLLSFTNCVRGNLVYTLQEEMPGITILGNVARDSNLENQNGVTQRIFKSFEYVLIHSGHLELSRMFYIEPVTSDLKAIRTLDRERLCPNYDCLFSFKVGANSVTYGFYKIINITVNVTDLNDNAPTFSPSSFELTIQENTMINESFPLNVLATDHDTGINSITKYKILEDSGTFGLDVNVVDGGTYFLTLVIKQRLDRETQAFYQIYVIALDGGIPPKTGMLTINIRVTDVNDNLPIFSQDLYNITIDETVTINSVILRVNATDRDEGKNGQVTYFLTITDPTSNASCFALNASTGEITLLRLPPSLIYKTYIQAQDSGLPVKSVRAAVIIYIKRKNRLAPDINVNFLFSGELSENASVNAAVAYIEVSVPDSDPNTNVTCTCNPCGNFELKLVIDYYTLNVAQKLDRESIWKFLVTITCSYSDMRSLTKRQSFVIEIKDENDNAPVFQKEVYIINITENNVPGETLLEVNATDADVGANGEIEYAFASTLEKNKFAIGQRDGVIRVNVQLDRESQANYSFYVCAHDNGHNKQLTSCTLVIINILDLNDEYPIFNQSTYTMSLMENINATEPVYIGQVFAMDIDEGENGRISYLIPTEYHFLPFLIRHDGIIVATQSLDREKISNYTFEVIAYDNGNVPKSSNVSVTVDVYDINDNGPSFLFPSFINNTIMVEMNTKPNAVIATIIASDSDIGNNTLLSYSIEAGNNNKIFKLDTNTGDIMLSTFVLESYLGSHNLAISAKDHGVPERCNQTVLNVIFLKSNITSPVVSFNLATTSQTIVIVISICCVILFLLIVFIIIYIVRTKSKETHVYSPRMYAEQRLNYYASINDCRRSTVLSRLQEEMIPMAKDSENRSKEMNTCFLADNMDGFTSSSLSRASVYYTDMSTFKSSQKQLTQIQCQPQQSTSQGFPSKSRIVEERDSYSDDTWETTTSDSGCDGSDDEVKSSTTNSKEQEKKQCATAF